MTLKELINKKDYDYISFRVTLPPKYNEPDIWYGACRSKNGKLIPLDGDTYSINEELVSWEEWSMPENNIINGLTVVEKGVWWSDL